MDRELQTVLAALRLDSGHTGCLKALLQIVTDFDIFMQVLCKIFVCIPLSIPGLDDAKTNTMRIYFLTQTVSLLAQFFSSTTMVTWDVRFKILNACPRERGWMRLSVGP